MPGEYNPGRRAWATPVVAMQEQSETTIQDQNIGTSDPFYDIMLALLVMTGHAFTLLLLTAYILYVSINPLVGLRRFLPRGSRSYFRLARGAIMMVFNGSIHLVRSTISFLVWLWSQFCCAIAIITGTRYANEALQSELIRLKSCLEESERSAWPWYRALGSKVLFHDRIQQRVLLHETILARYSRTLAKLLKQQSTTLDTGIERQQASLRTQQDKIDSLNEKYNATDERVKEYSEELSRTAAQLLELSTSVSTMQPQQILSSLTSAIFKFTKRFEDVFSDLDNHRKTMSSLEQGITDLQHRTAWMAGSSKQDRLEQLEQEVTVATKGSSLATTRAARRLSYGITPNASGQFLPPKIQHFEETSATLERRIREHERHMQDWMTAMEKRFPVQQAGLADPAANGHQQPSADVTTDNSSSGNLDAEKIKELLERKFKTVVAQSKNKFEVHEARLTALEKDFYKPVQQTLPVADRLDNMEYDVGNAMGKMKELTVQMSNTANSISLLHNRVDNLRLDMKNLGKKGEASTDHESLQCTKRAIEHLEEQHRGAFTKSKETAERMAGIERAVDQMRRHLLETTSRHDRRLWELDNSSRKAHGDIAAVHRGLNQQILELKASMLETDIDILDRVRFIGILQPQPEQTHAEDAYLTPRIISPDPQWDAVGGTSSSRSPPTPPTYSSFSSQVDDATVVLLPPIEPSSEIPSNQTHNGPLKNIDTVSSSPFGTISDSVQMDIAERHLALNSNSGATAIASSSADRIVAAEAVVEEVKSASPMTPEEGTGSITELSVRQPTIPVDGSTKTFAQSLKTWFSIQKNNQDPAAPDPQSAATLASSSSTPTTLRSLNSTSSTWHLTSSTGARMPRKE